MRRHPELLVPVSEVPPAAPVPQRRTLRAVLARLWLVVGVVCIGFFLLQTITGPERGVMLQIALALTALWAVVAWILGPAFHNPAGRS